jgi:hypothetical protein
MVNAMRLDREHRQRRATPAGRCRRQRQHGPRASTPAVRLGGPRRERARALLPRLSYSAARTVPPPNPGLRKASSMRKAHPAVVPPAASSYLRMNGSECSRPIKWSAQGRSFPAPSSATHVFQSPATTSDSLWRRSERRRQPKPEVGLERRPATAARLQRHVAAGKGEPASIDLDDSARCAAGPSSKGTRLVAERDAIRVPYSCLGGDVASPCNQPRSRSALCNSGVRTATSASSARSGEVEPPAVDCLIGQSDRRGPSSFHRHAA